MSRSPAPLSSSAPTMVIDIGGTNTRIALAEGAHVASGTIQRYLNAEIGSLQAAIAAYLQTTGATPRAACVAGAGPVRDGVLTLTNLDWVVDRALLTKATGAEFVSILNDLQAQGHALDTLQPGDVTELMPGQPAGPHAARLVVNVGTGMNMAPVFRLAGQTLVPPSEAGHALLPAKTPQELELSAFLTKRHGFPSIEEVLSGRGIEALYAFVSGTECSAAQVMAKLESDPKAQEALTLFVGILGRVTGNLSLISLPFGGVYFVGGVIRHTMPHLMAHGFAEAFSDKGRFSDLMAQFPVRVVTDDYAALTGCACHMMEVMAQTSG